MSEYTFHLCSQVNTSMVLEKQLNQVLSPIITYMPEWMKSTLTSTGNTLNLINIIALAVHTLS